MKTNKIYIVNIYQNKIWGVEMADLNEVAKKITDGFNSRQGEIGSELEDINQILENAEEKRRTADKLAEELELIQSDGIRLYEIIEEIPNYLGSFFAHIMMSRYQNSKKDASYTLIAGILNGIDQTAVRSLSLVGEDVGYWNYVYDSTHGAFSHYGEVIKTKGTSISFDHRLFKPHNIEGIILWNGTLPYSLDVSVNGHEKEISSAVITGDTILDIFGLEGDIPRSVLEFYQKLIIQKTELGARELSVLEQYDNTILFNDHFAQELKGQLDALSTKIQDNIKNFFSNPEKYGLLREKYEDI